MDILLKVGLTPLIGKGKKEVRKILSPLLIAGDFYLVQDSFVNVGGKERKRGFMSVRTNAEEELLAITFKDGLCDSQTLTIGDDQHWQACDTLKENGFRYNTARYVWRRRSAPYVWRFEHCANEKQFVMCRRVITRAEQPLAIAA